MHVPTTVNSYMINFSFHKCGLLHLRKVWHTACTANLPSYLILGNSPKKIRALIG